tara:strand:+ start:5886 stop:6764 length:879 start_codon:yes stop_codon:yes gene_type:complete
MKSKLFIFLLAFSALFIAGNAAFFSITGLSHLFAGAFWSVVIMASSLELGKLVTASFLHRYWTTLSRWIKIYLVSGCLILVGITSIGIFGYLSKAYQGSTLQLNEITLELNLYEEELDRLKENKAYLQEEMDIQISSLPDNYITARRNLRNEYYEQISKVTSQITTVTSEISDLKISMLKTGADVGPILYVADAFNTDVDTVVKWLIFILILVFDPLAVALVLATNIAITKYKGDKKKPLSHIEREIVRVPVKSIEDNLKKDNISEEPVTAGPDKVSSHTSTIKPGGSSKSF